MLSQDPLVSIITITRNSERFVEQAAKSVLSQSYSNLEYLIVDGESSDRTLEIVRRLDDPRIRILEKKPAGISDAMNFGIQCARGEVVGILHSDDIYYSDAIELSLRAMRDGARWSYGEMDYINDVGQILYRVGVPFSIEKLKKFMLVNHPTVFCHRSLYMNLGVFKNSYRVAMDYDLALRFALAFEPTFIRKPIAKMRLGGVSSGSYEGMIRAARETLQIQSELIPGRRLQSIIYFIWTFAKILVKRSVQGSDGLTRFLRRLVNPNLIRRDG